MARVVRSNSFASWLMVKVCAGMTTVAEKGLVRGALRARQQVFAAIPTMVPLNHDVYVNVNLT